MCRGPGLRFAHDPMPVRAITITRSEILSKRATIQDGCVSAQPANATAPVRHLRGCCLPGTQDEQYREMGEIARRSASVSYGPHAPSGMLSILERSTNRRVAWIDIVHQGLLGLSEPLRRSVLRAVAPSLQIARTSGAVHRRDRPGASYAASMVKEPDRLSPGDRKCKSPREAKGRRFATSGT
jgi:hypothetical protein